MRKLSSLTLVALIVLSFGACTLSPPSMGHLSISVPLVASSTASKALGSSARGLDFASADAPAIRIYVLLNGTFIPSVGKEYFQYPLTAATTGSGSNTFSIDLAPGVNYQVYVAIGSTASGWATKYYGATDPFTVSSGVYTNENLSVVSNASSFTSITPSATSAYAAVVNGSLWEIVGNSIIPPSGSNISLPVSATSVNSISAGEWWNGGSFAPELWLNTSSGIYNTSGTQRLSASGVKTSVAFGATIDATSGMGNPDLVIAYYGSDVGVAFSDTQTPTAAGSTWTIASLNSYINSPDGSSFKNLVTDPSRFVNAAAFVFDSSASYGYIATSLGSYYYNSSVQSLIGTDPITWLKNQLTSASPYALIAGLGGKSEPITSLALDDQTTPTTLYAGTGVGLYSTALNSSGVPTNPTLLPVANATTAIQKLAAAMYNGASYAAYIDGKGALVVLKGGVSTMNYPFYSFTALPTSVSGLVFYNTGSALELVVSCQDGLVVIPVS
jgi:hypothetical protein